MDLQAILQAFPARTKLLVIAAELPDGSSDVRVLADRTDADTSRDAFGDAVTANGEAAERAGVRALGAVERLQQLITRRGSVSCKPREWAHVTGLSARELRRAIDAGALPHEAKTDGRDHGAKLINADAMLAYLATVTAVERGQMAAPGWWTLVRGKRATAA